MSEPKPYDGEERRKPTDVRLDDFIEEVRGKLDEGNARMDCIESSINENSGKLDQVHSSVNGMVDAWNMMVGVVKFVKIISTIVLYVGVIGGACVAGWNWVTDHLHITKGGS